LKVEAIVAEPYSFAHLRPALEEATGSIKSGDAADVAAVDDLHGWARRLWNEGKSVDDLEFVDPEEGMELSVEEIGRVMAKLGISGDGLVFRGSPSYMTAIDRPVESEGARRIVECAMDSWSDGPIYVLALGCLTNVASALLMEPELARRAVVVWTSGYPTWVTRSNRPSLNLVQDPWAARAVLEGGVPLVYLPGYYVGAQLRLSLPDVETHVKGRGDIGDYLHHLYTHNPLHMQRAIRDLYARTWVMWDMINVAWAIEPRWVPSDMVPTPRLDGDLCWVPDDDPSSPMRQAHAVDRDAIFRDFFRKLDAQDSILQRSSP
jgi:hypothetical protein